MEDFKKSQDPEKDIVFSKSVKAGKRIYYVDVKRNKKGELFLALTESKKVVSGDLDTPSVNFEKHKIFLYQEDFDKFLAGLAEAVDFIRKAQPETAARQGFQDHEAPTHHTGDLQIDMDISIDDIGLDGE